jgi:IS5 family transposase
VLPETDPQPSLWEALLPDQAKRLPAELARIDAYLDDECFVAPWRALFDQRLGRPSVPVESLLRLLYLKHRYGLGYESLCREVANSLAWRRFCRIGLDRPVPHPTTLVKLVRRAGPEVVDRLNSALLGKLREDKPLRGRKLRVDTTVVEADIDHPTDADLRGEGRPQAGWAHPAHQGPWRGRPHRVRRTGRGRRGGGSSRSPGPCGGGLGRRRRRLIGSPPRSPPSPGRRSGRPSGSPTSPAARGAPGPPTATLGGWSSGWTRRPR